MRLIPTLSYNNILEWYKSNELHFSIEMKNYLRKHFFKAFRFFEIIECMNIPVCHNNELLDMFKDHSDIELTTLKSIHLIDRFKV